MKHARARDEQQQVLVHAPCSECPSGACSAIDCSNSMGALLPCSEVQQLQSLASRCKRRLGELHHAAFARIRGACNPFERIGKAGFVCRSAPKLATLDLLFDVVASSAVGNKLTFADICASPGGFSEYILRRGQKLEMECQGWGISLVERNEQGKACAWEIDFFQEFGVDVRQGADSHADLVENPTNISQTGGGSEPQRKAIYRASAGADGTGDLYNPANISFFVEEVHACGVEFVDLVVADGGFDFTQRYELQETASFKLILCEVLVMFKLLRTGGNFIVKLFDVAQPETQGLLQCLSQHFSRVSIVKPVTSRPANSERYAICQSLHCLTDAARHALVRRLEDQNASLAVCLDEAAAATTPISQPQLTALAIPPTATFDAFTTYLSINRQRLLVHQLFNCMQMLQVVEQEELLHVSELLDEIHAMFSRLYPSCPASTWDMQVAAAPLPKRFRKFFVDSSDADVEEGEHLSCNGNGHAVECICDHLPSAVACCVNCRVLGHIKDNACPQLVSLITQAVTR